jgi:plastocyanin
MNDDQTPKPQPTPEPTPVPTPEPKPETPLEKPVDATQWADNVQPLPPKPQSFIERLAQDKVQVVLIAAGVILLITGAIYYFGFGPGNSSSSIQQEQSSDTSKLDNDNDNESDESTAESTGTTGNTDTTNTETPAPTEQTNTGNTGTTSGGSGSSGSASTGKTYEISYSNTCFDPANRTIKLGDTIKFIDNSKTRSMWPASNDHPSHLIYPEFDPKQSIAPGGSWSFTFNKKGTWGYHDHLKPNCTGLITVQ